MEYTEQQFDDYKKRLALALVDRGLDGESIYNDTDTKEYLTKYVEDNLINKKSSYALQGIVHKLAHMDVNMGDTVKTYPIINKYKGHFLIETVFFKKNDGNIEYETIPVIQSSIIIK